VLVCVGVAPDGILLCEKHGHSEGEGNYQAKGGLYLRHALRSARNLSAAIPDIVVRWTWTWRRARQERQTRTARQDGRQDFI